MWSMFVLKRRPKIFCILMQHISETRYFAEHFASIITVQVWPKLSFLPASAGYLPVFRSVKRFCLANCIGTNIPVSIMAIGT
jgi:hypothetical protein